MSLKDTGLDVVVRIHLVQVWNFCDHENEIWGPKKSSNILTQIFFRLRNEIQRICPWKSATSSNILYSHSVPVMWPNHPHEYMKFLYFLATNLRSFNIGRRPLNGHCIQQKSLFFLRKINAILYRLFVDISSANHNWYWKYVNNWC